jgi:hypothetical protein
MDLNSGHKLGRGSCERCSDCKQMLCTCTVLQNCAIECMSTLNVFDDVSVESASRDLLAAEVKSAVNSCDVLCRCCLCCSTSSLSLCVRVEVPFVEGVPIVCPGPVHPAKHKRALGLDPPPFLSDMTKCIGTWETLLTKDFDAEFLLSGIREGFQLAESDLQLKTVKC